MGHIVMDETPTFWLDGHTNVLERLLHKSFTNLPHIPALWWGMGREFSYGKIYGGKSTFMFSIFRTL